MIDMNVRVRFIPPCCDGPPAQNDRAICVRISRGDRHIRFNLGATNMSSSTFRLQPCRRNGRMGGRCIVVSRVW